ncbi:hypothetical protein XELAEV_18037828mg [Xenopus laevis]|uniref:Uncharacterized protein n=1 Tax=Xenopus laevis TaxID=8355 RepID=A0A974CD29_XENLA|nr:hypothetical protein XELAEV_18037828mg [Xenopus laevis]
MEYKGSFKYGASRCITCDYITMSNTFTSHTTGKKYKGIQRVMSDQRGGDHTKKPLYLETKWIFVLATRFPMGLNSKYEVSCYF